MYIYFFLPVAQKGYSPRVMIMGALGRCGIGASDFARNGGIPE